jgi:hypothetical protein
LTNYYWAARFLLSGAICSYFVIVPALILGKLVRGKLGPFWHSVGGLAGSCFGAAALLAQMDLCGNPERTRTPNVMSIGAVILAAQSILNIILTICTYIYYYNENKKLNESSNTK